MQLQQEMKSNPKQSSCKSVQPQEGHYEKRYEIQGGRVEMAVKKDVVKKDMKTKVAGKKCLLRGMLEKRYESKVAAKKMAVMVD